MKPNEALQIAKDALGKALEEKKMSQEMVKSLGPAILEALKPSIEQMSANALVTREEFLKAIAGIKINVPETNVPEAKVTVSIPEIKVPTPQVTVNVPEIKIPDIKVAAPVIPAIKVPKPEVTVNVPEIKIPKLSWPEGDMPIKGWVNLMGVSLENPLPVQLRDASGKPVNLFENLTTLIGQGGGNAAHTVKVSGVLNTVGVVTVNPDGSPTYTTSSSGGSTTVSLVNVDGTYYNSDNPLPVTFSSSVQPVSQVSGHNWSVFASFDTTATLYNADNRLRVSVETGGSGLTDAELRASRVFVEQVSGANWSTEVTNGFDAVADTGGGEGVANALRVVVASDSVTSVSVTNTVPVSATNLDVRDLDYTTDDVSVYQVSGHSWSTAATIQNASIAVTQSGTWDEVGINDSGNSITVDVTDIFATTAASNVVNPDNRIKVELPASTITVSGSLTSAVAVGPTVADAVDDGSAPLQIGGIARTANPTAVSGGDVVKTSHDDLGRVLTRPIQVRDLIQTAYVSVTNGTETTLLAASAASFHDLIMIVGSNNSDAAVSVDIRAVTGGNIINTIRIPANSTAGWTPPTPWPQDATGNNWTIDGPDETGRTLTFSALFTRES